MNKHNGFTLIEVIICSMVFMLIASALASIMQRGLVIDREEQIINEAITSMVIARRLLMEGDPKEVDPARMQTCHKGLLYADYAIATLTPVIPEGSSEEYPEGDVGGLPMLEYKSGGERYRVWITSPSSMLVRLKDDVYPPKLLLGNSRLKLKVALLENQAFWKGSTLFDKENPTKPLCVAGTWLLYEDANSNDIQDLDEVSIPFRFSVALRNMIIK